MSTLPASPSPADTDPLWKEVTTLVTDPAHKPPLTASQSTYLRLTKIVGMLGDHVLLAVPHQVAKTALERELIPTLTEAFAKVTSVRVHIAISVDDSLVTDSLPAEAFEDTSDEWVTTHASDPAPPGEIPTIAPDPEVANPLEQKDPGKPKLDPNNPSLRTLNPKHTFDSFVIAKSNQLSQAAAVAVAENPAQKYNPLYIWGGSGLGKTHLLHATGNYALELNPQLRVMYVSSEEFTNDYINAVRDQRQDEFKKRYRSLDILMIDDIQFLQGKEGTQEEFFHTFNTLIESGAQIVLSSDRPPKELKTLDARLQTRMGQGLTTDVQPPDLETRIAILEKKAEVEDVTIDRESLIQIATPFTGSIRELEGALIRVIAYASLNHNQQITPDLVTDALKDLRRSEENIEVIIPDILQAVSQYFDVPESEICSTSKLRLVAHARQVGMYLARELTQLSLPKIGEAFGKDHTTVMYAERKISKGLSQNKEWFAEVQALTKNARIIAAARAVPA